MVTLVDVLGLALAATVVPALAMTYVAWRNYGKPGAVPFAVTVLSIAGWSAAYGFSLYFDGAALTIAAADVDFFFTDTVAIGWFLLALEYVRRERLSPRWYALFVFPAVSQVVVWTNDVHGLVRTAVRVDHLGILHPVFGPWFYVQMLFSYVLVVAGIWLLVRDFRSSQGIRRNQTGVLVAGTLLAFVANILYVSGLTPYPDLDLTPLAFLFSTTIFAYGLFRYRLLELLPIARKTVMDEMDEGIITLDENARVVDVNPAAADLFDTTPDEAVGTPGEAFFADYPEMVERFGDTVATETEISVTKDGEQRYFDLTITPISPGSNVVEGRSIVLRDITERVEREQELDLLKQVLSRVLRHNIRNDVTVVTGYAEELAAEASGEQAALAETIIEKGDDIAERSRKAAAVERVLTRTGSQIELELAEVAQNAVDAVTREHPRAEISLDLPASCRVSAHETLELALVNVIENAIVHNDADVSRVEVTGSCNDPTVLEVRDNGPGIPKAEIEVIEHGEETQLEHSSGIGLWLVALILERSGGDVSFENDGDGGLVRLEIPRA
jgi:PAS domain S-box-containing protein